MKRAYALVVKSVSVFGMSCLLIGAGVCFARYDCGIANTPEVNKTTASIVKNVENVYPHSDIQAALNHLTYFCCEKNYVPDQRCPKKDKNGRFVDTTLLYAPSPYLFDHLVDIGMRRLDGAPEEQYPDAGLDEDGKKRREQVRSMALLTQGAIPRLFLEQYKQAWKPGNDERDFGEKLPPDPLVLGETAIKEINAKRSTYGLRNKYIAMCYVADYIDDYLTSTIPNYEKVNSKKERIGRCLGLAHRIIQREFAYTKYIMIEQAINMVKSTLGAYLDGYFARDRLQAILSKFAEMQATFISVVSKVQEGTKKCSK